MNKAKATKDFWDIKQDPFLAREIQKYQDPLPSREYILQCMATYAKPINAEQMANKFQIPAKLEALTNRLEAMIREGQIFKNRLGVYALPDKMSLIKGRVQAHKDGYGWFIAEEKNCEDIYLSAKQMRRLWHGDIVLVKEVFARNKKKTEAVVVEIIARGVETLVGRIKLDSRRNFAQLVAQNSQIQQRVLIAKDDLNNAEDGALVEVEILEHPTFKFQAQGRVVQIFNEQDSIETFMQVAAKNHKIDIEFSPEVLAEAEKFGTRLQESQKQNRFDLTNLDFITIDGEDAKDFDDAIYCQLNAKGDFKLYVAIADVSSYVAENTQLDKSARSRGNSVYFPEKVIPMLPFSLSDNLCSLMPDVERLAMVCEMDLNAKGEITDFVFYQAVIKSYARMTYTQVGHFLDKMQGGEFNADLTQIFAKKDRLQNLLMNMAYLHQNLLNMRYKRQAINFNRRELRAEFTASGDIARIAPVDKNIAMSLIEEFMLCANVCSAQLLAKNNLPALYRNHQKPSLENLEELQTFLAKLGLSLENGLNSTAKDYENLLSQVKHRADFDLIQTMLLRSMNQAVYSEENFGHFALAYENYTHFTSPIRRYADLLLHRAIANALHSNKNIKNIKVYAQNSKIAESAQSDKKSKADKNAKNGLAFSEQEAKYLHNLGLHLSEKERNADLASRDVMDYLKARFMHKYLGYTFVGEVVNVTNFGLFVELKDIYIDGLIHISSLPMDYYIYDANNQCLVGRRSGKKFRLGDELLIQVASVDTEDRKIDFILCDEKSKLEFKKQAVAEPGIEGINLRIIGDIDMEDTNLTTAQTGADAKQTPAEAEQKATATTATAKKTPTRRTSRSRATSASTSTAKTASSTTTARSTASKTATATPSKTATTKATTAKTEPATVVETATAEAKPTRTPRRRTNTATKTNTATTTPSSRVKTATTATNKTATATTKAPTTRAKTTTAVAAKVPASTSMSVKPVEPKMAEETAKNKEQKALGVLEVAEPKAKKDKAKNKKVKFEELIKTISEQDNVEDVIRVIEEAESKKSKKKNLNKKAIEKAIDKKLAKKAARKSENKKETEKLKKKIKKQQKKLKDKQKKINKILAEKSE